ncbi:hypothetical protein MBLNU13_g04855t2 [Cladosporium sp. NU13]
MSSNGLQHNPPSYAKIAAVDSGMVAINIQPGDADPAALQSAIASTGLEPAIESESPATEIRAPVSLLTLPPELRLRIYELLGMIIRGVLDVDTSWQVHKVGSRTSVLSRSSAFWDSPDALNIIKTNKQLQNEAANFFYANKIFRAATLPAFAIFWDEIGPTGQAQDEHFRSRFATQLSPPGGHWWSKESAHLARQHIDFLRRFAWGLLGQAEDEAGRREKFKILKVTTWMGPSARHRAAMISQHRSVLHSDDYDGIMGIILPRIELELEADGWFA